MADFTRTSPPPDQIWMTRGHLAALAVATLAIAVLSFMVGLKVGRGSAPLTEPTAAPAGAAFLPNAQDEDALEALLQEVERAQTDAAAEHSATEHRKRTDLSFNRSLSQQEPDGAQPSPPAPTTSTQLLAPPISPPTPPAQPGSGDAPSSGWAVQIASYEDAAQATAHAATLSQDGLSAYTVAGLVDGVTWYRVRIGGYKTVDAANSARAELASQLDLEGLMVATAP